MSCELVLCSEGRLVWVLQHMSPACSPLQAMSMSTSSSDGLSSSVTDDLFFILQKCLGYVDT